MMVEGDSLRKQTYLVDYGDKVWVTIFFEIDV